MREVFVPPNATALQSIHALAKALKMTISGLFRGID
jgi:hypothetical protein